MRQERYEGEGRTKAGGMRDEEGDGQRAGRREEGRARMENRGGRKEEEGESSEQAVGRGSNQRRAKGKEDKNQPLIYYTCMY